MVAKLDILEFSIIIVGGLNFEIADKFPTFVLGFILFYEAYG
jgi:hypothetical protein